MYQVRPADEAAHHLDLDDMRQSPSNAIRSLTMCAEAGRIKFVRAARSGNFIPTLRESPNDWWACLSCHRGNHTGRSEIVRALTAPFNTPTLLQIPVNDAGKCR